MLEKKYYTTEGSPAFINEVLAPNQWSSYVNDYDFGSLPPTKIVLHHTYSPNIAQWAGLKSMRGMQNYYGSLGWFAGPHIYTAPDGIWLATPMKDVGVHANAGNANLEFQAAWDYRKLRWYSIGVEMVGFYDKERPSGLVWENTLAVLGGLCKRFGWKPENVIGFHRDFNQTKSCPGWSVTKDWVYAEVNHWLTKGTPEAGLLVAAQPRITLATFVKVLTDAKSPAADVATDLFNICVEEGIDPAVFLAFAHHETKFNTVGIIPENELINLCAVRTPEDSTLGQQTTIGFATYPSYQNCVRDWCKRLKGPKYAGRGLNTVERVVPVYAPSSDGNKPEAYIAAVKALVAGWSTSPAAPIAQPDTDTYWKATRDTNIRQMPRTVDLSGRSVPIAGTVPAGTVIRVGQIKNGSDCETVSGSNMWGWLRSGLGFVWLKNFVQVDTPN